MARAPISRRALLAGGAAVAVAGLRAVAFGAAKPTVTVYKSPT